VSPSVSESESGGSPEGENSRTFSADESRVANLAVELGCDFSWGIWASRQFTMGISPAVLEAALHEAVNCGKLSQPYVGKIAARFKRDGIPKATYGKGKASSEPVGGTNGSSNTKTPSQRLAEAKEDPPLTTEQLEETIAALEAIRRRTKFQEMQLQQSREELAQR
jgi:hypothetical protein